MTHGEALEWATRVAYATRLTAIARRGALPWSGYAIQVQRGETRYRLGTAQEARAFIRAHGAYVGKSVDKSERAT